MKKLFILSMLGFIISTPSFLKAMNPHEAAIHGDIDRVRELLDKEVYEVDAIKKYPNGSLALPTPLYYAARFGHPEIVKLLLERGAHPESPSAPDWSPLAYVERIKKGIWLDNNPEESSKILKLLKEYQKRKPRKSKRLREKEKAKSRKRKKGIS